MIALIGEVKEKKNFLLKYLTCVQLQIILNDYFIFISIIILLIENFMELNYLQ